MNYIDLHTHQTVRQKYIQVENVFAQDLTSYAIPYLHSAGLHPWHIGKVAPDECFSTLERSCGNPAMLMVGECGLDRAVDIPFNLQEKYFLEQINLAESHQKPLIVHCVRAYNDLARIKKQIKTSVPWIIHGFSGKPELVRELLRHGFYFSVGERLLTDRMRSNTLLKIPSERLFLETDESDISIQKIYFFAAQILGIEEEALANLILTNFKTLFGDGSLVAQN